ncbi:MAG: VWA domain-containing protein, partial [Chloroflexota bacterium]
MKNKNSDNLTPFFSNQAQVEERQRRWRLVLGKIDDQPEEGEGEAGEESGTPTDSELSTEDQAMDQALESLYGDSEEGDLGDSNPDIARWLGDIRNYFPDSVVQIMQRDALKRLNLRKLLAQPEFLEAVEPDLDLVSNILALKKVMPEQTKQTAKQVVRKVVEALQEKLTFPMQQAIIGSLDKAQRTRRPKHHDINWLRTIHTNLKHYQPDYQSVIPETLVGYGRQRSSVKDVILALDTSGSMTTSVVYGSVYAAVMASINALTTKVVMFDTAVVDISDQMDDPVEALFGIRLGGGTNIDKALAYCQQL